MKRPSRNELMPNNNFKGTHKRYANDQEYIKALEAYVNELEAVKNNCVLPVVSNSLVADIRNKLTPPLNLCAMIKNLPRPLTEDTDLNNLILKEVKQTEISIKYLSNL